MLAPQQLVLMPALQLIYVGRPSALCDAHGSWSIDIEVRLAAWKSATHANIAMLQSYEMNIHTDLWVLQTDLTVSLLLL